MAERGSHEPEVASSSLAAGIDDLERVGEHVGNLIGVSFAAVPPRSPRGAQAKRWVEVRLEPELPRTADDPVLVARSGWLLPPGVLVVSTVEVRNGRPEYHIAVTRRRRAPKPRDIEKALRDFGMNGARRETVDGPARHYWKPVDYDGDVPLPVDPAALAAALA